MHHEDGGRDMKTALLSKSPSDRDQVGVTRLVELAIPRPTRAQYFATFCKRIAALFIPIYTTELVLYETREALAYSYDQKTSDLIFGLNFVSPLFTSLVCTVMIVDDIAFEFIYYRLLEHGLLPRFERRPVYTGILGYFIALLAFGSSGVVGYFDDPRQGGLIGLQAMQLVVLYYVTFMRDGQMVTFSHFFGTTGDLKQQLEMLQKFTPITERQLIALCVHKRKIYDQVKRGLCCPDVAYVRKNFKTVAGDLYEFGAFARRLAANPGLPDTCSAKCNPSNHLWAMNAVVTTELFPDAHDAQISHFIFLLKWLGLAFVAACQIATGAMFALAHRK
jgi:hypothetical protein